MLLRIGIIAGSPRAVVCRLPSEKLEYQASSSSRLYRAEKWHSGHSLSRSHVEIVDGSRTCGSRFVLVISKALPDGDYTMMV